MFPLWAFYKLKQLGRLMAKNTSSNAAKRVKSRPGSLHIEVLGTDFFNLLNLKE